MNKIFSRMNVGRLIVMGAVLFFAALPSFAADVSGRIRGTVVDPQGAVIPNATVSATNEETGVVFNTQSNGDGNYEFLKLPIGNYTVAAKATGFEGYKASGIKLDIDTQYNQKIQLAVGNASDTVNVNAEAVQVDTTNIQLNNVVGAAQIVELPLLNRNFTNLETILPGVQASSDRFGGFSANGAQTQQSSFLINGTDTNDLPINTITFTPSVDAIAEFNLITSSLNPEYSRNSGAIVSATIKNGTNHFHGDVFEFYRDTFLNTHNFFQKTAPVYHEHIFGGTLGGPIFRDKLFFFGSYEGRRARQPQNVNTNTVFSAAQRGGDFSTIKFSATHVIPGTIKIPGCASGVDTFAICFAKTGGKIDPSAFNPISASLINQFVPLPNSANNQFLFNPVSTSVQDQGIGRIDFSPTARDQVYGIVTIQHAPTSRVLPFTGATLPGFGDQNTSEIHQYVADYTHTFGISAVNDFSLHYTRFNFVAVSPQHVIQPSALGFAIVSQNPSVASVPRINVGSNFSLGFSSNGPQPRIDQTYQVDENFSKIIGRHSLKFGYDGRRFNVANPFFGSNNGTFAFSNSNTQGSGSSLVDFALGIPNTYNQGTGGRIDAYAFENYLYFQDQWKVRSDLTLTYGLGWQADTALHNRQFKGEGVTCFVNGVQSKIFPSAPAGLVFPGDPGCNDANGAKSQYKDFGPRIGFAYSPESGFLSGGSAHKLSIRGGYGIYYNRSEEESSLQNLGDPPFGLNTTGAGDFGAKPSFQNPFQELRSGVVHPNKFPVVFPSPGDANVDFTPFEPFGLSQYAPGFRVPYSMNYNLTVQRELPSSIVATFSYVGSVARHLTTTIEGNPITQAGHDACLTDQDCIDNQDFQGIVFPSHTKFGNGDVFASAGLVSSTGASSYNSLQLSATKAPTHGLLFQVSYTYSHSLDNASSFENAGFGGGQRGYNQFNPGLNYGDSQFDARHRFVFSPVYRVPSLRGSGAFVRAADFVTGGWQVSGILTLATGFPYDVSYGGGVSFSLFCSAGTQFYACPDIPDQIAPLKHINPRDQTVRGSYIDPASFADETIGSFGNISRNKFHGPGINNTNVIVAKNFKIIPSRESMYLQLRMESDNVFNHTQFNLPDGNFSDSTFGRITGAAAGRQSQLAAKFYF